MREKEIGTRSGRIRAAGSARRQRQKEELRAAILKAAGELFLQHGYENFSLRQVAERIGYSPTTIYLYFQNKDDLLLTAVQDGFQSFDRRLQAAAQSTEEPLKRLEALGRAYVEFGLENPALYRLMFMQRSDFYFSAFRNQEAALLAGDADKAPHAAIESAEIADEGEDTGARAELEKFPMPRTMAMELLGFAVESAMDAGLVRRGDALLTADVLWAGVHGLVSLAISPLMTPEHADLVLDHLLKTLLDGVRLA